MFTLLNPFALLALLGLLVPVAIHLWNRRPGREVAVGSLRWLAAGANRRLRNLKLEQVWLLLLRAALLAVLAVAVAEPVWRQRQPASRGQVLLSPEVLGTPAFTALRPTIDSLRRRGYVVRWLANGFSRVPSGAWRADSAVRRGGSMAGKATDAEQSKGFAWARMQEAADVFSGQPLFVVTSAAMRNFQGIHSPLPTAVTWQLLPNGVANTWLQAAALRADSLQLQLQLGQSNEMQTSFRLVSVARPQPGAELRVTGLPALRFEKDATGSQLKPLRISGDTLANPALTIPVRTQPLHVIIYATADYAADARYLRAALRAAAVGLPVPLALTTTAQIPTSTTPADWLFWLSDAPLPAEWRTALSKGTKIWQEARGAGVADTATLATNEAVAAAVVVFRRDKIVPLKTALPLWTDSQGRPVLTRQAQDAGAIYQLHTRLDPAWSELGDDPALPAQLLALLQPALTDGPPAPETALDQALATQDQRVLDPAQLFNGSASPAKTNPAPLMRLTPAFRVTDLRPWLVLAAGLLFLLERLLARRREVRTLSSPLS
ncbi:BatA domain-containing protein [Hymenobacter antarcticus]|uniref:Aerotolerance regulator N-terminal domain-containing protein n=1 Tax=Hymenobacter antarcticus TaxID=486270 RepID=A0ABP7PJU5_9BACT